MPAQTRTKGFILWTPSTFPDRALSSTRLTALETVLTLHIFFRRNSGFWFARCLGRLPTSQRSSQANDGRESAANEHPDCLIRRRAGKESGNIRGEGVGGVESDDDKHNSANEECDRNDLIHNSLSKRL